MEKLQPAHWPRPRGYSNAVLAHGPFVFLAGMVGWDETERFVAPDLLGQLRQILKNIKTLLTEAGSTPDQIVRMTWYVTDMDAYRRHQKDIGAIYRAEMGKHFPAMACLGVTALAAPEAVIEIEVTAALK